jgi:F-type H+-transporting ATPase subunit b
MATQTTDAGQAAAGAAKAGMPQLDFSTFSNQIFWLVITLVVIYFVLSRIALPRIGGALADRAGTITNDLAEAEDLKSQALAAEQAYEKALADARAEAQNINVAMRAEIQGQLDAELAKADAQISARTEEAAAALAGNSQIGESQCEDCRQGNSKRNRCSDGRHGRCQNL